MTPQRAPRTACGERLSAVVVAVCTTILVWLAFAAPGRAAMKVGPSPDPFAHWAAVVVAGDWRAAGGGATEGFDNARRDVSATLERAGFEPSNLTELSARPNRYPRERLERASVPALAADLKREAASAKDGCLLYLTTHGAPYGVPVGDWVLTPVRAAQILNGACGARPTVVIISACFSGIFIPKLAAPDRMILTAARSDRTSFGCGQDDRYPYFDTCILQAWPSARNFLALAAATRTCVARRERAKRASPPSDPQLFVGSAIAPILKADAFLKPEAAPVATPGKT